MIRMPMLVVLVACVSLPASAQGRVPDAINRGSWLVAGSASVSRNSGSVDGQESEDVTVLELRPSMMYFVAPRVALGGQVGLGRISFDGGTSTTWSLGPSARYYFAGSSAKALPYVGAGVAIGRTDINLRSGGDSDPNSVTSVEALAGITWLFTRQVGFVSEAYFTRSSNEANTSSRGDVDVTETSFGLRFGFAAFIPKSR